MKKESTELKTLQLGDRNPLLIFYSSLFSDRPCVCVYYCSTYYKAVREGGGGGMEDMCYERLRAKAGVI
jgi:hypothetical protein